MVWKLCFNWYYNNAAVATQGDNLARPAINAPTNATLKIKDTKLYVQVVTLS